MAVDQRDNVNFAGGHVRLSPLRPAWRRTLFHRFRLRRAADKRKLVIARSDMWAARGQRLQTIELMKPGPFTAHRFRHHHPDPRTLSDALNVFPAHRGVVADATAMTAAAPVATVPERAQQIGLRTLDQRNALSPGNRKPFFECQLAGKAPSAWHFVLLLFVIRHPEVALNPVILRRL
jgi:hypothetical protein